MVVLVASSKHTRFLSCGCVGGDWCGCSGEGVAVLIVIVVVVWLTESFTISLASPSRSSSSPRESFLSPRISSIFCKISRIILQEQLHSHHCVVYVIQGVITTK